MSILSRLLCFGLLGLLGACARPPVEQKYLLTGRQVWQGEVHVRGDLELAEGAELRIAPGTRVLFEPPAPGEDRFQEHPYFVGSELIVRGRLIAEGTRENPIRFMAGDSSASAGSWGGINIEDAPEVRFAWCRFSQANSAVHARNTSVSIRNSVFASNLVGVRFHDARMELTNNLFEKNEAAIRFHLGAPTIRHNLIRNNHKGLFITSAPKDYLIEKNSFVDNDPYQVSLGEGVRKSVDLSHNFWSDKPGKDLETRFFDGRLDDWLGRVEYLPVLAAPAVVGPQP